MGSRIQQIKQQPLFKKWDLAVYALLTALIAILFVVFVFGKEDPALTGIDVRFDSREEYAKDQPHTSRAVCGDYTNIKKHITLTERDYVVVVTHGHSFDYEVLAQTLDSPARYVGCMGSRRKTAVIRERLKAEAGISEAGISRLRAPIGIAIGAQTPAELAVSIAAELISVRAEL